MASVNRKLLHDAPAQKDAFSGGGHDRTARSLARTILELDQRDAVIGLDGKWGSGKSSVITMAADHLAEMSPEKTFHLVTFDLWANQSVPFRRGFLERLLEWAQAEEKFGKHKAFLADQAKRIGGKIKQTEINSHVEFNWLGVVFVLSLPLLPLIYAWLSPFAIKPTPLPECEPNCAALTVIASWIRIHATDLALAAAGVLFGLVVIRFLALVSETRSIGRSFSRLGSLIERKGEEKQKNELIRDVDPTNYEFAKTFREILQRLQGDNDRVVFVFDNIDRLETANIPAVWADIIAVLQRSEKPSYERVLTAVLPYDKGTIETVLRGQAPEAANGSNENKADPDDLFRKSFDVILHVSQPVVSDTRQFFIDRLEESLGDQCDKAVAERIARIFDLSVRDSKQPPTPRRVISFINEVTTRWVEWDGEIPIDSIAVYVANRDAIDRNRSAEQIASVVNGSYRTRVRVSAEALEAHLAMLTFSAPRDLALEVMLAGPIERSLTQPTADRLKALTASRPFPLILAQVLENSAREIAGRSATEFDLAVGNLLSIDDDDADISDSLRLLVDARKSLPSPSLDDLGKFPNIMRLPLAAAGDDVEQVALDVVGWLGQGAPKAADRTVAQGRAWVKAVGQVRSAVMEATDEKTWRQVQSAILIPAGADFACGVATDCDEAGLRFREFDHRQARVGLGERIVQLIADNDGNLPWILDETLPILSKESVPQLIDASVNYINSHDPSSLADADEIGRVLDVLSKTVLQNQVVRSADKIKAAIQNGAIIAYLHKLNHSDRATAWADTVSRITVLLLFSSKHGKFSVPNAAQHPVFGDITASVNWFSSVLDGDTFQSAHIEGLARAANYFRFGYQFVALAGDSECKRPVYQNLAITLLRSGKGSCLAGNEFIARFERLRQLFDDDLEPLIAYGRRIDESDGWSKVEPLTLPISAVEAGTSEGADNWPRLMASLDEGLIGRTAEDWEKDLASGGHVIELAQLRIRRRSLRIPIDKLKEPLIEHAVNVARGSDAVATQVDTLCASLPASSSRSLPGAVLERLRQEAVKPSGITRLIHEAPGLMSQIPFEKLPEVTFRRVLLPAVEALNRANADYIISHANQFRRVVREVGSEASSELAETLAGIQPATHEGVDRQAIAEALGVKIDEPPSDDTAEDGDTGGGVAA